MMMFPGFLLGLGCADLAMQSDRIPTSIAIVPSDTLIVEGEPTKLRVIVRDQSAEVIPLPTWAWPSWTVSHPSRAEIASDGTVNGLRGGETLVEAKLAGLEASATIRVNPRRVALSAPIVYLTQGIQNPEGAVRLIAGRQALIRVFMIGDETSYYGPSPDFSHP